MARKPKKTTGVYKFVDKTLKEELQLMAKHYKNNIIWGNEQDYSAYVSYNGTLDLLNMETTEPFNKCIRTSALSNSARM